MFNSYDEITDKKQTWGQDRVINAKFLLFWFVPLGCVVYFFWLLTFAFGAFLMMESDWSGYRGFYNVLAIFSFLIAFVVSWPSSTSFLGVKFAFFTSAINLALSAVGTVNVALTFVRCWTVPSPHPCRDRQVWNGIILGLSVALTIALLFFTLWITDILRVVAHRVVVAKTKIA